MTPESVGPLSRPVSVRHLPPEGLEETLRGLVAGGFAGANVTIPHKRAAALLCAESEGDAVNTLVFADGRIHGFNTDR